MPEEDAALFSLDDCEQFGEEGGDVPAASEVVSSVFSPCAPHFSSAPDMTASCASLSISSLANDEMPDAACSVAPDAAPHDDPSGAFEDEFVVVPAEQPLSPTSLVSPAGELEVSLVSPAGELEVSLVSPAGAAVCATQLCDVASSIVTTPLPSGPRSDRADPVIIKVQLGSGPTVSETVTLRRGATVSALLRAICEIPITKQVPAGMLSLSGEDDLLFSVQTRAPPRRYLMDLEEVVDGLHRAVVVQKFYLVPKSSP